MKVLTISPYHAESGLSVFYHRAFARLDVDANFVAIRPSAQWISPREKILAAMSRRNRAFGSFANQSRLEDITSQVSQLRPDLVFVVQGDDLSPSFVQRLKTLANGPVFLYYSDNPWVSAGKTSHFWESLADYDCVFTFFPVLIPHLYQKGAQRVVHLPFAFDPLTHAAALPPDELKLQFASPVAYIGTYSPTTEKLLRPLVPYGLKIWGNGWERASDLVSACWQSPGASGRGLGREMAFVCSSTEIVVNFVRSEHWAGHSMKTFELPACGAFVLSTRTDEQEQYFPEGISGAYFSTQQEMLEKVEFYLNHPDERERIRKTAHQEVMAHDYKSRAQKVLDIYEHKVYSQTPCKDNWKL